MTYADICCCLSAHAGTTAATKEDVATLRRIIEESERSEERMQEMRALIKIMTAAISRQPNVSKDVKNAVFSIKKTLNSQGNLKNFSFKVLTIGFYTFFPSFRQIMDTVPKKLFLFQGKPLDEPFFNFFKIGEALLCD